MKKLLQTLMSFFLASVLLIGCNHLKIEDQTAHSSPSTSELQESTESPDQTLVPTIDDAEAVIHSFSSIYASFTQQIKTTGWIRQVSTKSTFSEQTQSYMDWGLVEEWFRFDEDGNYVEGYNWVSSPDGTIEQESCFNNGRVYNITSKSFNRGEVASIIDFSGGFADAINNGNNIKQEQVNYQGVDAFKFSYEMTDGSLAFLYAIYFDSATHLILGKETWLIQSDGATKLVSSTVIDSFEVDVDPPLDHFQGNIQPGAKIRLDNNIHITCCHIF